MKPDTARKAMTAGERRRAILDAALTVFAQKGFANARMEDIARGAKVGKGTVYLYFPDKESLFKALVSADLGPVIANARDFIAASHLPSRQLVEMLYMTVEREILATRKRDLLRLMITEMSAFPAITEQYYRHLVEPGLALIGTILERAGERGELRSRAILDVPQFVIAPVILSVLWNMLFSRFAPFETRAAFDFQLDTLFISAKGEPI